MTRLLNTLEIDTARRGSSVTAYQIEHEPRLLSLCVCHGVTAHGVELTPRQALALSAHLLAFSVRCAQ